MIYNFQLFAHKKCEYTFYSVKEFVAPLRYLNRYESLFSIIQVNLKKYTLIGILSVRMTFVSRS